MKVDMIISSYKRAAIAYGEAMDNFDRVTANQKHKELTQYYAELKKREGGVINSLKSLLNDEHQYVALWAATHLLNKQQEDAVNVLNKLKQEDSMVAISAESVLDLWENDNLEL